MKTLSKIDYQLEELDKELKPIFEEFNNRIIETSKKKYIKKLDKKSRLEDDLSCAAFLFSIPMLFLYYFIGKIIAFILFKLIY